MRRRLIAPLGLGLFLMLALVGGWARGYAAPESPAAASRVALPAVDVGGQWTSQITVQNMGTLATFAVLELYADSPECPGGAPTPVLRTCLGAVGPSQSKTTTISGLPAGAYAGYVTAYSDCPDSGGTPVTTPLAVVVARQINLGGALTNIAASAYTAQVPDLSAYDP